MIFNNDSWLYSSIPLKYFSYSYAQLDAKRLIFFGNKLGNTMLQFLRNMSSSWIMKIILGLLVLSFGLFWGISDVFRSRNYDQIVAVVGGIDVSKQALIQAVQNQIKAVNAELKGKTLSLKQFDQLIGIQQVLDKIIDEVLLDRFIKDAGIKTPNTVLTGLLLDEPSFRNAQGQFDKQRFFQVLQANGLTEAAFIHNVQKTQNRLQLMSAMVAGGAAPAIEALRMFQYFTTERTFTIVDNLPISLSMDKQEIKSYFEAHKDQFKLPERRKIFTVILNPSEIGKKFTFSAGEIKDAYAQNIDAYIQPEKRTAIVALAKTVEEAAALQEALNKKVTLSSDKAHTLTDVTERGIQPPLGAAIFGAPKGKATAPLQIGDQYVVIYVQDITPSQTLSLTKARDLVIADLRKQKALDEISKITESIEVQLNKGMTIYEVAKNLKLSSATGLIDAQGNVLEGNLKMNPDILKDALGLSEGEETPLTESSSDESLEGISYIVKVEKIMPARIPVFEEVQVVATKAWEATEKKNKAKELYEALKAKAMQGGSLQKVVPTAKKVGPFNMVEYDSKKYNLAQPILKAVLAAEKGQILLIDLGNTYALVQIDTVNKWPVEKNIGLYKMFKESVAQSINQHLAAQFLQALRAKYGVEIHTDVVKSLTEE